VTHMESTSTAYIDGDVTADESIFINSESINQNNDATAQVPGSGITEKINKKIKSYNTGNAEPGILGIGAAVADVTSTNTADARIGAGSNLAAGGEVSVISRAEDNFKTMVVGGAAGGDKVSIGGAVNVATYTNEAVSRIEDGAVVNAGMADARPSFAFDGSRVDTANDTIALGIGHGLRTGEALIYRNEGNADMDGLSDAQACYVLETDDPGRIRLAKEASNWTGTAIVVDDGRGGGENHLC